MIRIPFLRIRIQLFFSMRIRIQPKKICNKLVLDEELKQTKKIAQYFKKMEPVHNYLIFYNEITISTNFLAFFCFILKFSTPRSGSRRENDCGSESTALPTSPSTFFIFFYNKDPDHDSIILPDSDQQSLEFEESRT